MTYFHHFFLTIPGILALATWKKSIFFIAPWAMIYINQVRCMISWWIILLAHYHMLNVMLASLFITSDISTYLQNFFWLTVGRIFPFFWTFHFLQLSCLNAALWFGSQKRFVYVRNHLDSNERDGNQFFLYCVGFTHSATRYRCFDQGVQLFVAP